MNQVIPFGRIVWIVTMKFRPVKIELEAQDEHAERREDDGSWLSSVL